MLNRLPKNPGSLADLLADIGQPSTTQIARALGVSRRTVERWKLCGAPRIALLALWWLSQEGHSTWNAEMANRTRLALQLKDSLWRAVKRQRAEISTLQAALAIAESQTVLMARNDPWIRAKDEPRGQKRANR